MSQMDLDVTRQIQLIEQLKNQLLQDVSGLYANMLAFPSDAPERTALLADLILSAYLLNSRLGQSSDQLDEVILQKLRASALEEKDPLHTDKLSVLRHLSRKER